jgi:hypothetical protein
MSRPACDHPLPLENLRSEPPTATKPDQLVQSKFQFLNVKNRQLTAPHRCMASDRLEIPN